LAHDQKFLASKWPLSAKVKIGQANSHTIRSGLIQAPILISSAKLIGGYPELDLWLLELGQRHFKRHYLIKF